ncbi:aspartyl/asparaginyl beta-hydroxylase domain-containing protein [Paraburkholderia caribensis]|uniref:aspartyl/asparaginyl beta-hydroxylase domain-containing protein n=1 Tax=Paraburkholderia caribensis TaxID=75105 RepID=UPI00078DA912|nr:aspartyl/asparaginyl beta-hydroxylase domain-containing protein [Paraburkholderia caribensis]AMV48341.1 hypothetical protein ATN79_47660 [Paraburkholderia caribensis]
MNSQIVGTCNISLPEAELSEILSFEDENRQYSEFHYGDWKTFAIWNQSGLDDDGAVLDQGLPAKVTKRGKSLRVLNDWIAETFDTSRLKLVRIHSLGDGVLIPHRDFVEFEGGVRPWTRVHVPLMTNDQCLHSEEETVFRMRAGEVWFLDASNLHSATNFSVQRRLNLCLDFDLDGLDSQSVFNNASCNEAPLPLPEIVQRPPLDDQFEKTFQEQARELNRYNFRDMLGWLAKIHFRKSVHIATFFQWMVAVCEASGDASLHEKALRYSKFLQHERQMGERFVL